MLGSDSIGWAQAVGGAETARAVAGDPGISSLVVTDTPDYRVLRDYAETGATRRMHNHADATWHVFTLVTGRLSLTIEGQAPIEVGPGQVVTLKGGANHTFKNIGTVTATIVEVFGKAKPESSQLSSVNKAGVTFGHVHLNVPDIEVHKRLFVDVFGGAFVQKGPLSTVKFPGMIIAFRQGPTTGPTQGTVMDHFGFKVRDIAAMLQTLRGMGYEVQREFTGAEGFPNAYVLGPDGLRIEMQEDKTLNSKAIPNHIHFWTADYVKLLDWYADTFALTKRKRGTIETTADAGTVNLSFADSPKPVVPTKGRTIDHIGFEVKDIDAFVKQLEAKGIKLDAPVRDVPSIGLKVAFFTDPSGTYIELTEGLDKF
jgi:catechol 2,3-dioxygenase-like lactoylglutathione lyase family enzyme/mannose-6-phosphate isomerase-like protein (cupin superfamily)